MKNRTFLFLLIASVLCAALVSCARVPASAPVNGPAAEAGTSAGAREVTTAHITKAVTTLSPTQTTAAEIPGAPDLPEEQTTASATGKISSAPISECDYLVLVNKTHALPEGWENVIELVQAENCLGETFSVERQTLNHFLKLQKALAEDGIDLELYSTYRSVERQKEIREAIAKENGEDYAKRYVAEPGHSEHHTGLAIDACIVEDGAIVSGKEVFPKVHARLAEFGFILRYPEGKEEITGFAYENWHFRYVGAAAAKEIYAAGLTLEEYLGEN